MTHAHAGTGAALLLVVALAVGYEALTFGRRPWNPWRGASFMTGCLLLVAALAPGGAGDFTSHVCQHLVVGMVAPVALVFGAPVTLLLRTLPTRAARRVGRFLHRLRGVTHPVTALLLSSGSLVLLHVTPLYTWATADPVVHELVLVHFLLSGWLFAWVVAGPDPAPRRPSVRYRLVVLGVAVVTHAVLSQLLYAGVVGDPSIVDGERRAGATLLYYGADAAELLLAFALLATRRRRVDGASTAATASATGTAQSAARIPSRSTSNPTTGGPAKNAVYPIDDTTETRTAAHAGQRRDEHRVAEGADVRVGVVPVGQRRRRPGGGDALDEREGEHDDPDRQRPGFDPRLPQPPRGPVAGPPVADREPVDRHRDGGDHQGSGDEEPRRGTGAGRGDRGADAPGGSGPLDEPAGGRQAMLPTRKQQQQAEAGGGEVQVVADRGDTGHPGAEADAVDDERGDDRPATAVR